VTKTCIVLFSDSVFNSSRSYIEIFKMDDIWCVSVMTNMCHAN
jgi:hypothetical protein